MCTKQFFCNVNERVRKFLVDFEIKQLVIVILIVVIVILLISYIGSSPLLDGTHNQLLILFSVLAFFVSFSSFLKVTELSETQLRLSHRNEFKKMLIDLDKELIKKPELFAIFDKHPLHNLEKTKELDINAPLKIAERQALCFLILNIFDTVYNYYYRSKIKTHSQRWKSESADKTVFTDWMNQILEDSEEFRKFFREKQIQAIYPEDFVEYINQRIDKIEKEITSNGK
jgi:hypothetical protein